MTTGKVLSSVRDGASSATVHSWQMTAGCSTHVPRPLERHGRRALNVWWTVPPAWLNQQSTDDVECRRQMPGEGIQQGTSALFHEDSVRPERAAGMWLAPELATNGAHGAWGYAFWPPRWENQTGGGIQDGLQPVLQLSRDTGENRVAVVHLADNQCTNQGQQGMTWQGSPHAPDLTYRAEKNVPTTAVTWVLMFMSEKFGR